jgi:hypothetical protein
MTNRSELLQRVLADTYGLRGWKEKGEVYHVRKLADLKQPGRKRETRMGQTLGSSTKQNAGGVSEMP